MYNHREAFCLMRYATDDMTVEEILWNSRDGVTPFVIMSRDKQHELTHVDFFLDERNALYVPPVGSRIFVDLTPEKALEYATTQVERQWEQMQHHDTLGPLGKEGAAQHLAQANLQPGAPDVAVIDKASRDAFYIKRARAFAYRRAVGLRFG